MLLKLELEGGFDSNLLNWSSLWIIEYFQRFSANLDFVTMPDTSRIIKAS